MSLHCITPCSGNLIIRFGVAFHRSLSNSSGPRKHSSDLAAAALIEY